MSIRIKLSRVAFMAVSLLVSIEGVAPAVFAAIRPEVQPSPYDGAPIQPRQIVPVPMPPDVVPDRANPVNPAPSQIVPQPGMPPGGVPGNPRQPEPTPWPNPHTPVPDPNPNPPSTPKIPDPTPLPWSEPRPL
jgi:hypothetical protein